jgi:hypothetical protein
MPVLTTHVGSLRAPGGCDFLFAVSEAEGTTIRQTLLPRWTKAVDENVRRQVEAVSTS